MMAHPSLCVETPEQLAWDLAGERVREREHKNHSITIRKRPEGLYLAKFYHGPFKSPQRFLGETASQAEQFAIEYIDKHYAPAITTPAGVLLLGGNDGR